MAAGPYPVSLVFYWGIISFFLGVLMIGEEDKEAYRRLAWISMMVCGFFLRFNFASMVIFTGVGLAAFIADVLYSHVRGK